MRIEYEINERLPLLAWVCAVEGMSVQVTCGCMVECHERWWVSGAWAGEFETGAFDESEWFCGTGGSLHANSLTVSTPSHVTSGVYYHRYHDRIVISNSLYLLMAECDLRLDDGYRYYEADFNSILMGISSYRDTIRVLNVEGELESVKVAYYRVITINEDHSICVDQKPKAIPFVGFADYNSRLHNAVFQLLRNAADPHRKHQLGSVTTISSGYDAACCAAVSAAAGCQKAVTFRAEGKYAEDSGIGIAKGLGLSVNERDAMSFIRRVDLVE